jgi:D-sedoheptulose 7-phosphate isomerase
MVDELATKLINCFKRGNIAFICGNGGSWAESNHFSSEFTTHGMPVISLCNGESVSAIANDFSWDEVFSKQLKVLGKKGDILIGLSTSGKSKNILKAYKTAKKMGIEVIDWPREKKAKTPEETAKVQEEQLKLMHLIYLKFI